MSVITYTTLAAATAGGFYLVGKYGRMLWDRVTGPHGRRR